MVKRILLTIIIACCTYLVTNTAQAQQQSQKAMQQQEAAAKSQLSASGSNVTYPTPYKLFQAYYAGVTGTSTAATYACFTPTALSAAFEGNPPTTPARFAAMDAADAQRNPHGYVLRSFVFTANPTSPQMTAVFSLMVNNPQNAAQPMTIPVTDKLTLIDTPSGWMINVFQEQ